MKVTGETFSFHHKRKGAEFVISGRGWRGEKNKGEC
jgi:hypothetical protein